MCGILLYTQKVSFQNYNMRMQIMKRFSSSPFESLTFCVSRFDLESKEAREPRAVFVFSYYKVLIILGLENSKIIVLKQTQSIVNY